MNPSRLTVLNTIAVALLLAVLAGCSAKEEAPMREQAAVAEPGAAIPSRQLAY
jgi:uncharacterized protein YcfL